MSLVQSDAFIASNHLDNGMNYHHQNRFYEAICEYDNVLRYQPHFEKFAHWNKATALLALGDYEAGFREYDWGWRLFSWRGFGPVREDMDRITHLPVWDGEDIRDKGLLIYHELGFGDAIQTMRYLPELKARAGHVTLVINRELVRLAQQFDIEVVDHVPADLSHFSYRLPFFGVMMALRQTMESIPKAPYIHADFLTPMDPKNYTKDVGIVWSGRTQTMFTLECFLSMLEHGEFDLYSLQPGKVNNDEVNELSLGDFQNTADMIELMDHIVTVDSAVAHLAGAMGHPSVHLLLPYHMDWRWWHSEAWYPQIKKYRQTNSEDWFMPFERLNRALAV